MPFQRRHDCLMLARPEAWEAELEAENPLQLGSLRVPHAGVRALRSTAEAA